jgi:sulfur transfer protein SufE
MTLRERQDHFLETFNQLPDWTERFNYLILCSSQLVPECPQSLRAFKIQNCQSRTYFRVSIHDRKISASGWSNSAIMGGLAVIIMEIFDGVPVAQLACTEIDFHIRSALVTNMTPMRTDSLREIVRRITVLLPPSPKSQFCP